MSMRWLYILLFMLSGVLCGAARPDVPSAAGLVGLGFDNVRVGRSGDIVYAAIEDPTYRGTYRGLGVALQHLAAECPGAAGYEVVLLDSRVPQVCAHGRFADDSWTVDVDYDVAPAMAVLADAAEEGSSRGKIDITFHPKVSLNNHRLDVLYEWAVAIAPSVETTLWRGNRITLQPVIPLCGGNLYENNTLRYVRMGIAAIEQEFLSGGRWNLRMSAGLLYSGYMGVNAEVGYRFTDALSVKLQAGCTGDAYRDGSGYHFTAIDRPTYLAKADYYERLSRLQVQLTAGRFIYGDYGARVDVTRHFGDYAIGLYGILANGEHNAGFHFAIPMMGRRQKRRGAVRLRIPEYFNWEYSMVSYYKYADENMGREYKTRADENRSARYFQADYIGQNLQRYLDGVIR